jgi:hypothetical protein
MRLAIATALALCSGSLAAEVTISDQHGFQVVQSRESSASATAAYRAMTEQVDEWWSKDHSWSGDANNFYMNMEPGGCFCEKLPGGGVAQHLGLLFFKPGEQLVFDGALGPLLTMPVNGRMVWTIDQMDAGSRITFTYHVTGHPSANLPGIAPAVDGVIGEQLDRLAKLLNP